MASPETSKATSALRFLPAVDDLLRSETAKAMVSHTGAKHLAFLARTVIDALRQHLINETPEADASSKQVLLERAEALLAQFWHDEKKTGLQRVINATGVIIHTNLGRAPLSDKAVHAIVEQASAYCTLEYDLETGKRGRRGARAERLLAELTGAESALIVNNCAAAAFLVLKAFGSGGEVIISRGELVEIGGDFRIPDVLSQSGAILKEVGTTNRTKLSDYEKALGENTRLILKVHPSNYRIVGFTASPNLAELADLAHRHDILLYEDAGSGALFDLSRYGLNEEPVISQSISAGADIVTFSGDKLLGGPQAGLIVGKQEVLEKIRKHPLYRALRVDKFIYAALEATLEAHRRETAMSEIPVLKMLSVNKEELAERVEQFSKKLSAGLGENRCLQCEVIEGTSVIGGGSAPTVQPETILLSLKHEKMSSDKLDQMLRNSEPPVITRILDDQVLIDLRTVSEREETELLEILKKF